MPTLKPIVPGRVICKTAQALSKHLNLKQLIFGMPVIHKQSVGDPGGPFIDFENTMLLQELLTPLVRHIIFHRPHLCFWIFLPKIFVVCMASLSSIVRCLNRWIKKAD